MAILPVNYEQGKLIKLPMYNGGSTATYTVGQALTTTSGYYATATAGQGTDVEAVCMQGGTVTTNGTLLTCITTRGVKFVADTDGTPAQTQVGAYADLAGATTIDEDASADDLFYIEKIVGPLADKKVQGYFQHGTPLA